MKKKVGFNLRSICGEHVIVAEGKENIDFSKIISMNETSAYLWEAIEGKEFTAETLADLLLEQYEVEYNIAYKDCLELIVKWEEAGIIEPSCSRSANNNRHTIRHLKATNLFDKPHIPCFGFPY